MFFVYTSALNCDSGYVLYGLHMTHCNTVLPIILRTSYGTHLLDHLAAYGAGLTAIEVMDLPEFDHCTKAYHNWFQEILNSIL